jgi:hypothetical protein
MLLALMMPVGCANAFAQRNPESDLSEGGYRNPKGLKVTTVDGGARLPHSGPKLPNRRLSISSQEWKEHGSESARAALGASPKTSVRLLSLAPLVICEPQGRTNQDA